MLIQKIHLGLLELFRDLGSRFLTMKPDRLFIVFTRKCNARCAMCRIWAKNNNDDLSMKEWQKIFSKNKNFLNTLMKLDITGGEPFLRKDIIDFISMSLTYLPALKKIIITSNGLLTDKILAITQKILTITESRHILVSVTISIDGIGNVHDTMRGVDGLYDRARETLRQLQSISLNCKRLSISVTTVIHKLNCHQLTELHEKMASELHIKDHLFVPAAYSENFQKNLTCDLDIDKTEITMIKKFLHQLIHQKTCNIYHKLVYQDIIRIYNGQPTKRNCPLLKRSLLIDSNGEIIPCFNSDGIIYGKGFNSLSTLWTGTLRQNVIKTYAQVRCPSCRLICGVGYWQMVIHGLLKRGGL